MPVALIRYSTCGSIRPGGGGGAVEDREALEERNSLCLLASLVRAALFVHRHKAVGIDDGRAALALADVTTERQRLAEGKPALPCKSARDTLILSL
jgi:hypothetical protein